jgi:hypothetical protein
MTRKKQQSSEEPNMSQRALMQHLSLDEWKIASRLPIPAGELMLSRIREYGWIEIQGEKQIRQSDLLRPGSRQCGRQFEVIRRLVELGLKGKSK